MRFLLFLILIAMVSCQPAGDHGHSHGGHDDPSGQHDHASGGALTVDTTVWTKNTELFVEFPALVAGKVSRFTAHFTKLEDYQPVRKGAVTVSLIKGNKGIRNTAKAPTSPGIFTPSLKPKEAGEYKLRFEINAPGYRDRITINKIRVFSSKEQAEKALASYTGRSEAISFTKEQAWQIEFQTKPVKQGEVFEVINTSGTWKAAPGGQKTLTANASGIIGFAIDNLTEGKSVEQGQLLMTVSSNELTTNNLKAEIEQARADYQQAKAAYERKKELHQSQIVPQAELEQAENRYRVAKSAYETLKQGYSAKGKQIRAPFSGYIKAIHVDNGTFTEQGAGLITLGTDRSRILKTQAAPSYNQKLTNIHNIFYHTGAGTWSSIKETGGSVISIGKKVSKEEPMIPIYAQVNEQVSKPEGGFSEVQIATGEPRKNSYIPESALLEDYGKYSVIVQLSGERYERRPIKPGRQNGHMVEILEGLKPGERVVTKGAYQVKMASMSGQAAGHGHAH